MPRSLRYAAVLVAALCGGCDSDSAAPRVPPAPAEPASTPAGAPDANAQASGLTRDAAARSKPKGLEVPE